MNRVVLNTSMFRADTGKQGQPVQLNLDLSLEEKVARMRDYWVPYYRGLSRPG